MYKDKILSNLRQLQYSSFIQTKLSDTLQPQLPPCREREMQNWYTGSLTKNLSFQKFEKKIQPSGLETFVLFK